MKNCLANRQFYYWSCTFRIKGEQQDGEFDDENDNQYCKRRLHCGMCQKDFADSTGLRKHMRNVHQDGKREKIETPEWDAFKCKICGEAFQRYSIFI